MVGRDRLHTRRKLEIGVEVRFEPWHLKKKRISLRKGRESAPICWCILKTATATAGARSGQSQGPGVMSEEFNLPLHWERQRTHCLSHHLPSPRIGFSRKLELQGNAGVEPRYSTGIPSGGITHCAISFAPVDWVIVFRNSKNDLQFCFLFETN